MKLFHETENKYYELLSYLVNCHASFTDKDLYHILENQIAGEMDFEVINTLFSKEKDGEMIFQYKDKNFTPVINEKLPIRNTAVELQAAKSIANSRYAKDFLSTKTRDKLEKATEHIVSQWNDEDIHIKNQYLLGDINSPVQYEEELRIIREAIEKNTSIYYDNVNPGKFEYRNCRVFPVKIEYSLLNDRYRISAYEPEEKRFIQMNLCTMSNIRKGDEFLEGLAEIHKEFLEKNTKELVLDVEPVGHVIERCFRIFSYYDRKAFFDREENKYRLEISYLEFDEKEIIRDILSLGSHVVVMEPENVQQEVYTRIKKALMRCEDNL